MSHAENRGDYFDFKAPRTPEEDDTKKTGDWSTSFGREDSSVSGEINKKLSPDKELTQQIDIRDIPLNPPKKEKVVFLDMNPKNPKRLEDWFTFVKLQGWGELLKNETVERLKMSNEEISLNELIKELEKAIHESKVELKVLNLIGELRKVRDDLQKK